MSFFVAVPLFSAIFSWCSSSGHHQRLVKNLKRKKTKILFISLFISFCNFSAASDSILRLISHAHFPLESLALSNNKFFPSDAIRGLPTLSLSSVRSLKLSKLTALNDPDLAAIADFMGNVEELDLVILLIIIM